MTFTLNIQPLWIRDRSGRLC